MIGSIKRLTCLAAVCAVALATDFTPAQANPIFWTDWQTGDFTNGFTGNGQITTNTQTLNVTYTNTNGIQFYYTGAGGETDYWANGSSGNLGRNPARSAYTSALVDNIPTGTDMIALNAAGSQTLTFSQSIANPVFSYISLNGNGYAFDQDFDILSFGDGVVRDTGYWGPGTSSKNIVNLGGGNFEYQLLGTGEPHGTIRFTGAFNSVTWRSLSNESWNGFTVGVQGTSAEVLGTPEPGSLTLALGAATLGLGGALRRRRRR